MTARRKLSALVVEHEDRTGPEGLRMASVTVAGQRRLLVDPAGMLFSEILSITHYPLACKPKPRMTWSTRYRHPEYFSWVEHVRFLSSRITLHQRVDMLLIVRGGLRGNADLSNAHKAVEDALRGVAYPDDNIKHIRRSMQHYVESDNPTFAVVLGL